MEARLIKYEWLTKGIALGAKYLLIIDMGNELLHQYAVDLHHKRRILDKFPHLCTIKVFQLK